MPGIHVFASLGKKDVDGRTKPGHDKESRSGLIAFAAKPDAFLGFHLRHLEQTDEHGKLVPPRKPGQGRDGLRNEQSGLVGPAISRNLVALRAPGLARGSAPPPAPCPGQKPIQCRVFLQDTLFESTTIGRIFQLFG
jgi:hypothetical protein